MDEGRVIGVFAHGRVPVVMDIVGELPRRQRRRQAPRFRHDGHPIMESGRVEFANNIRSLIYSSLVAI